MPYTEGSDTSQYTVRDLEYSGDSVDLCVIPDL